MSRVNEPFQVLVVTKNTLLTKDKYVGDLQLGELGVFDKETKKSVDGTRLKLKDVFFGIGYINTDGIQDIKTTDHVAKGDIAYTSYKEPADGANMKVLISNFAASDTGTYNIHIDYHNTNIYRILGFNRLKQYFEIVLPQVFRNDANHITNKLVSKINSETNGLVQAKMVARTQIAANTLTGVTSVINKGAEITEENFEKIITYNALPANAAKKIYTDIELEFLADIKNGYNNINLNYAYPRQTSANVVCEGDFRDNHTISVTQAAKSSEGDGYDVQYLEYQSFGYEGGAQRLHMYPRVSADQHYMSRQDKTYHLFCASYNKNVASGWQSFVMPGTTVIAVEKEHNTIIEKLKTIFGV